MRSLCLKKKVSGLFSTHPQTEDRVAKTKENIENFLEPREQCLVTTSEFQRVKTLLVQLQERQKPTERDRAPSLRQQRPSRRNPNDEDSKSTDKDGASTKPADRTPDPDAPPVLRRPQDRQP